MTELIKSFDDVIFNILLSSIFGETLSTQEKKLLSLSMRDGDLVIEELTFKPPGEYEIPPKVTKSLVIVAIKQGKKNLEKEEQQTLINEIKI